MTINTSGSGGEHMNSTFLPSTCHPNAQGGAGKENRCHLHPHWQQFEDETYGAHAMVGLIMFLMSVFSIAGNLLVIIVFSKFKCLRTAANTLIINLSVSDLGMAVTGFPLYIIASFNGKWPFPEAVCEFYGFTGAAFGLLSINTLAVISLDRYIVIVKSSGNRKRLGRKAVLMFIIVIWLYSLLWAVPPLFGWNKYTWEGFGTTCSFDYLTRTDHSRGFILAMFLGGFIVPLLVICFTYGYIMLTVWKQRRNFFQGTYGEGTRTHIKGKLQLQHDVEIKTAKTVGLVIFLYCLSWLPYATVSLIGIYGNQKLITPLASAIPGIFAKASTVYNPIVYAICIPRFKKKIHSMFLKTFCGIDGELVVVDKWSSYPDQLSQNSSQSGNSSGFYRKPAVRAPSGMRRSSFSSISRPDSNPSSHYINRSTSMNKSGIIIRRHRKDQRHKNSSHSTHSTNDNPDHGGRKKKLAKPRTDHKSPSPKLARADNNQMEMKELEPRVIDYVRKNDTKEVTMEVLQTLLTNKQFLDSIRTSLNGVTEGSDSNRGEEGQNGRGNYVLVPMSVLRDTNGEGETDTPSHTCNS